MSAALDDVEVLRRPTSEGALVFVANSSKSSDKVGKVFRLHHSAGDNDRWIQNQTALMWLVHWVYMCPNMLCVLGLIITLWGSVVPQKLWCGCCNGGLLPRAKRRGEGMLFCFLESSSIASYHFRLKSPPILFFMLLLVNSTRCSMVRSKCDVFFKGRRCPSPSEQRRFA